ncbi:7-cyano-7-deazaguanine synthase [Roseixanthobacter glucoisosaccharinicivorans]|uniref:7-cyano-7-deazaguanine synthase n=1 Tax=Roseixanthobacter glucoisosaccharinicivorans TaxID=3119923 RepID=UPI00372C6084
MKGILLSGGMDSIALAYWQRPDIAFTVDYGQAASKAEIAAAGQIASLLEMRHEIISVDCSSLGSGHMAGTEALDLAPAPEWWPFRNQLLVTLAGMRAVAIGVTELMVGSVASDDVHADGRRPFYEAIDGLMRLQEGELRVTAPALGLTTAALVRISGVPQSALAWAHSCHVGDLACGVCRGCVKHYEVTGELTGRAY